MPGRRTDRVGVLIQRELSDIIQRELKDPRVSFCTISQVQVSTDLRYADVKVSVVGDKRQKRNSMPLASCGVRLCNESAYATLLNCVLN